MKHWVDISVMRISHHAVCRFCERVMRRRPFWRIRKRAIASLAHRLHFAEPLGIGTHDGYECQAWQLFDCVVITKQGTVTTVLTPEMWEARGFGSEA